MHDHDPYADSGAGPSNPRPAGPALATSRRPAHLRSSAPTPSAAEARRLKNAVGGDMVASMKRGKLAQRPSIWERYRVWILAAVALALVVYLNAVWLGRIAARVQARGGWASMLASLFPSAPRHDEI